METYANLRFSDVFRVKRKRVLPRNGLMWIRLFLKISEEYSVKSILEFLSAKICIKISQSTSSGRQLIERNFQIHFNLHVVKFT